MVTYVSKEYEPAHSYRRYVRRDTNGTYHWCEAGDGERTNKQYDYRQGTVDPEELSEEVRSRADARCGFFPSYVEWPA